MISSLKYGIIFYVVALVSLVWSLDRVTQVVMDGLFQRGEFHISHNASLHTILSSFQTHVMLSVQQGQLNSSGKRLVLPITLSVPLLCRSIYDFRFTTPNICLVKSKRVFWPPIMS